MVIHCAALHDETRAGFYNLGKATTICNGAGTTVHPITGCAAAANRHQQDHDANRRKARDTYIIAGTTYAVNVSLAAHGEVLWKTWPDGDSSGSTSSRWTYDSAGRLFSIPGVVTSTTYNARGQVTNIAYTNGVATAYTYDAARGWLTSVYTTRNGATVQSLTYYRDVAGRITSVGGQALTYDANGNMLTGREPHSTSSPLSATSP